MGVFLFKIATHKNLISILQSVVVTGPSCTAKWGAQDDDDRLFLRCASHPGVIAPWLHTQHCIYAGYNHGHDDDCIWLGQKRKFEAGQIGRASCRERV